ncbi:MFS transporter [Desertihabitans brevis]|uniref:MFS transporter n=1 Tax=Desertihabitans brevis TaxID=2268447 RepID=UPI001314835F|nr:MFS transporter [Desertihabitans brevis]
MVLLIAATTCVMVLRALGRARSRTTSPDTTSPTMTFRGPVGISLAVLAGIGALGALAFAAENAQQSWSAVYLEDELAASASLSALGPAVFAGVVAVTRFAVSRIDPCHARTHVLAGAATATLGAGLLFLTPNLPTALAALALAAAGTAVLLPTLLRVVSRAVSEARRARATSTITVIAYTGFLAGPAYVGPTADAFGLRGAMLAVAALTAVMAALTPLVLRAGSQRRRTVGATDVGVSAPAPDGVVSPGTQTGSVDPPGNHRH